MANQKLHNKIETVYNGNRGAYSSPRIYREFKDQDITGNETSKWNILQALPLDREMKLKTRTKLFIVLVGVVLIGAISLSAVACYVSGLCAGTPIELVSHLLLHPSAAERGAFIRYHPVDYSASIAHVAIPEHPFMAPNTGNNMHCDA